MTDGVMLGTMYGHFAIRRSAVLRAIGTQTTIDDAVFTMDLYSTAGRLLSVAARSCPEAQDRTTYAPIRSSFVVVTPLEITRICLRYGHTTLFDKMHAVHAKVDHFLTTDWILGTDDVPESDFAD